jgi:hypothetical protein
MISSNVVEDVAPAKDEEKLRHLLENVAIFHGNVENWHGDHDLQVKVTSNILVIWASMWKGGINNKGGKEVMGGMRVFGHTKLSVSLFNLTQTRFWHHSHPMKIANFKGLGNSARFTVSGVSIGIWFGMADSVICGADFVCLVHRPLCCHGTILTLDRE